MLFALAAPVARATVYDYDEYVGDVRNPLRGWYCKTIDNQLNPNGSCTGRGQKVDFFSADHELNERLFRRAFANGHTLVYDRITLDINKATIPQQDIGNLQRNLAAIRGTGVKAIIRFRYGQYESSDCWHAEPDHLVDAKLRDECRNRIKAHIAQTGRALRGYEDAIAYVEVGWFGDTGEGSRSETFTTKDPEMRDPCLRMNNANCDRTKEDFYASVLESIPPGVALTFGMAKHLREAFDTSDPKPSGDPRAHVAPGQAYSGKPISRVALRNDCLGVDDSDAGAYHDPLQFPEEWKRDRQFVIGQSRYTFTAGETCSDVGEWPKQSEYSDCRNAVPWHGGILQEMQRTHWASMENEWASGQRIIDKWREQGCYEEITRRLGYRIVLVRADIAGRAVAGEPLALSIGLRNDGFAAMYHPRPVYLVFDDGDTRRNVTLAADPRRWAPNKEKSAIEETVVVPADLPPGQYKLALWMPDASPRLAADPNYAVRTANTATWNAASGYNELGEIRIVDPDS